MTTLQDAPAEGKRGRIKDARGRSVSQLDPVMLHVWHRYDTVEADALEEIVEELEPGTARRRKRMILIVPSSLLLLALGVAALYYFSDSALRKDLVSLLTNPAIMLPTIISCVFLPWIAARQARMNRVALVMLKHRRCPHCGYNLRGLPVAHEDGATVCPECGCAWRIDQTVLAGSASAGIVQAAPTVMQKRVMIVVLVLLIGSALVGLFLALRIQ